MRVLFATTPQKSVFLYLAPMAWALRTAGHEVRFASQPALTDVITQSGLTAVPVGHPRNLRLSDTDGREEGRAGLPEPYDVFADDERATWEYLEPGMAGAVRGWHWLTNHPMIGGLVEFARAWQPDLIVWEPFCYAGPIAAKACGAAHARLLFGVDVFGASREQYRRRLAEVPGRVDHLGAWLGRYAGMYGAAFSEDMTTGQFTIDQFPASLQVTTGLDVLRTQYIPYGGPAVVPDWLSKPPERPRVAMTLGLTATEHFNGYTVGVQEALDALADLDIDLVATVAEKAQAELTRIPGNARIVSYVPWHALAPTCSVVVHHAGAATMATTSRHPVPQLALHHHYDQPFLGRKLAGHGAGLDLPTHRATGARIRESVERLLTEQSFKDRAADLRDEILGLPSPNAIVPEIEARVAKAVG
jgi:glycosyltransferase (activator-dependent family)